VGVNVALWLFCPNVFWFWWNAIGGVTTLATGTLLSLMSARGRNAQVPQDLLARPFPARASLILLLFFLGMLAFCLLLPRMF
jgi:sodium-dependent multivitamin transporter 6